MWTVLLVEDEILVRESIRQIIPWEKLGFTVIAEADDGVQALECMRIHTPDLVITDIIMPFMNGVELLKAARSEHFDSRFIVLSCMSDFEYVREAMEYGASNYILKLSMNIESLQEALEKVQVELLQLRSADEVPIQQYYEGLWQYIVENMTSKQHLSDGPYPVANYDRLNWIVVTALHGSQPLNKKMFLKYDWFATNRPDTIHTFSKWGQTTFFCGFNKAADGEACREALSNGGNIDFPLAYSSSVQAPQLSEAWRQTLQQMNDYWYAGDMLMTETADSRSPLYESTDLWALERSIILLFEQSKAAECCEAVNRLFKELAQQGQMIYTVQATVVRLGQTFGRMMNRPFELQDTIADSTTHRELLTVFVEIIRTKLQLRQRNFTVLSDHPEINKVIEYIRANYNQELTVKGLAKYVAIDEKYLSSLFKKKTGESLIHFLQRVRIRRAEYYLQSTSLSVSEIGSMVGFPNDNYFIKIFRRWNKQTPSQYRKSFQA